jgi:feruloyl-CoA synthase
MPSDTRALFAPPEVTVEKRAGGGMVLRSAVPMPGPARSVGAMLAGWAARDPERLFLAGRDGAGWRRLSYGEVHRAVRTIGAALLKRGLGPENPVMIVSDNGIDHALLALGAMHVGVPVAPVSTAYSRMQDFSKLRQVAAQVTPGLIFADDGARFGAALAALETRVERVAVSNPPAGATLFAALTAAEAGDAVDDALAKVGPDTVAKILFTSGSTGEPKGVINTQRMLCSNQAALSVIWPFLAARPPVMVDWLPWSHTFGGNFCFNLMLRNGGTYTIDDGKPAPGLIERSVENLRGVSPTIYFNVPRGYALLLDHLEADRDFARGFFGNIDLMGYAGAALPESLFRRVERAAEAAIGRVPRFISAWGTTETAPAATVVHYPMTGLGNIGVPIPGCEVKLVPEGDKLEVRVRGPNITPGYWRRPDLTAAAFDDEKFYRPGDAMRLADPDDANRGLVFDGRIGENFKLSTGTWVAAGALRVAAIAAAAPVIEDAVVTGHDRDEIGLLVFASLAGCRSLCPHLPKDAPLAQIVGDEAVCSALRAGLARHNASAGGSSQRILRALILATPPSIDRGEITDKGYINQRAVLTHRAADVNALYAVPSAAPVIVIEKEGR